MYVVLLSGVISCHPNDYDYNKIDLDKFSISIPEEWTAEKLQGLDSYVGQIVINDDETLCFDYGWYSNKLEADSATHDFYLLTSDNKRAKIVKPKDFGFGLTGVYFDSLEVSKSNKFQLSGNGLSPENQKLFLKAIESIIFE